MTEINEIYTVERSLKCWPVKGAYTLEEASDMIFGSPYWELPQDRYKVIDKNETYILLAVYKENKASNINRYLVVNMDLLENAALAT
ncbi:MAG: hypothetical protein GY757_55890 [bacterium]|nr:hypothetical protein [bacterium]